MIIKGNVIDILNRNIYYAALLVDDNGVLVSVTPLEGFGDCYIFPGFVDSHVHIESSMLTPHSFANHVQNFGTAAVFCDPHEIANVCGVEGVNFMIDNAAQSSLQFYFGAPSCVPATTFETSGATFDENDILNLLNRNDIFFLSEVMNFPAVINGDSFFKNIIAHAHRINKVVDGHSPSLSHEIVNSYFNSGIQTCHESDSLDEALLKLSQGAKIHIREGSAAKNLHALHSLVDIFPNDVMLCTDDSHPDDLLVGHINLLVKRLLFDYKHDFFNVLKVASINAFNIYNIPFSFLKNGSKLNFYTVNNLLDWDNFSLINTMFNSLKDSSCLELSSSIQPISPNQLEVSKIASNLRVIQCFDGSLLTDSISYDLSSFATHSPILASIPDDILKIVVVNRYSNSLPSIAFIKGFGFKTDGVIASSIAHDSHNYIAVGSNDELISNALNFLIQNRGGLYASDGNQTLELSLPIAGLLSDKSCVEVGNQYRILSQFACNVLQSSLTSPFMTLSFMSLLVIPSLKISDKGLFDGNRFSFIDLQF